MARPTKRGLDYFPLDVDMMEDSAVAYLEAKHGIEGWAVLVRLFMRAYRDEGYYLTWDEREQMLFGRMVGLPADKVAEIVATCLDEGLFDRKLYERHGVLTSRGMQARYFAVAKRRTGLSIRRELLLDDEAKEEGEEESDGERRPTAEVVNVTGLVVLALNEAAGTSYRATSEKTRRLVQARLREGFELKDFEAVIAKKSAQWLGSEMEKYLRPETLFGTKFEGYLNERKGEKNGRADQVRTSGFKSADKLLGNDL